MDYLTFYPQFKLLSLTNEHQNNSAKTIPPPKMHSKKEKHDTSSAIEN